MKASERAEVIREFLSALLDLQLYDPEFHPTVAQANNGKCYRLKWVEISQHEYRAEKSNPIMRRHEDIVDAFKRSESAGGN